MICYIIAFILMSIYYIIALELESQDRTHCLALSSGTENPGGPLFLQKHSQSAQSPRGYSGGPNPGGPFFPLKQKCAVTKGVF